MKEIMPLEYILKYFIAAQKFHIYIMFLKIPGVTKIFLRCYTWKVILLF